jgi:hypothetical protein
VLLSAALPPVSDRCFDQVLDSDESGVLTYQELCTEIKKLVWG